MKYSEEQRKREFEQCQWTHHHLQSQWIHALHKIAFEPHYRSSVTYGLPSRRNQKHNKEQKSTEKLEEDVSWAKTPPQFGEVHNDEYTPGNFGVHYKYTPGTNFVEPNLVMLPPLIEKLFYTIFFLVQYFFY